MQCDLMKGMNRSFEFCVDFCVPYALPLRVFPGF